MTPAARYAAAAACIDRIVAGAAVERVLTNWARSSRFAGSKDRAAIRDLVFDAVRNWRSYAWIGGGDSGRCRMLGLALSKGHSPRDVFTGGAYAMPVLREDERAAIRRIESAPWEARFDAQSWTRPLLEDALGADTEAVLRLMRERAPVFLRVNALKADVGTAREMLAEDGIETRRHDLSAFALLIIENPRRVAGSRAYREGLVELQDAASQAVVEVAGGLARDGDVLDYCAGGGGKALALAACKPRSLAAHDVDPRRMKDIPDRALRAGCKITVLSDPAGLYDLVFCDAPCSGSGAWRRQPEAKWTLTEDRLNDLTATQDRILERAAELVREGGCLAYATCSLFSQENEWRVERFLGARPDWTQVVERRFLPLEGGDGFFIAVLRRP